MKSYFSAVCSQLPPTQRYISKYFCELLGGITSCLFWGFATSWAITLLIHQYGKFEISLAITKYNATAFSAKCSRCAWAQEITLHEQKDNVDTKFIFHGNGICHS